MRFALATCSLAAVVAAIGACDLFDIACNDDGDCPTDVPFCVDGSCDENEARVRDDDGDGPGCSTDDDCAALCFDVDDGSGLSGTCIPAAEQADCEAEPDVQGQPRDSDGPVLFAVDATSIGDGCYSVSLRFFDRQGDAASGFFSVVVGGAEQTQSVSITGDTVTSTMCGGQPGKLAGLQMHDGAGNRSNVACLPVAAAQ